MNFELFKGSRYECSNFKVEINGNLKKKKKVSVRLFKIASASSNRITKMRAQSGNLGKKIVSW